MIIYIIFISFCSFFRTTYQYIFGYLLNTSLLHRPLRPHFLLSICIPLHLHIVLPVASIFLFSFPPSSFLLIPFPTSFPPPTLFFNFILLFLFLIPAPGPPSSYFSPFSPFSPSLPRPPLLLLLLLLLFHPLHHLPLPPPSSWPGIRRAFLPVLTLQHPQPQECQEASP